MTLTASADLRTQLADDGFCLVPKVLTETQLDDLRTMARRKLEAADAEHLDRYSHHGSLLPLKVEDQAVSNVLTSPQLSSAFSELGFTDPRWISGYVIAKPPNSPGLWWHQDWWGWGHPRSYVHEPTQIFCMIYLEPTSAKNGCLRAIPQTHLNRHPLHDALPEPHTVEIESKDADEVSNLHYDGEIDIEAEPGDLVIGDVRVIHATHANRSDAYRTAVDLLFLPHYETLPNELKQHYVGQFCLPPSGWWQDSSHELAGTAIADILPTYNGPEVSPVQFNRTPCWPESGSVG